MIDLHDLKVKAINQLKPNVGFAYNDEEGIVFCLCDYRAVPDYFDSRHDGKRGCVRSFYSWGDETNDPRLHGGRL